MGGFFSSLFGSKSPKTPVKGPAPRIKSFFINHYRGLIGIILPLIILPLKAAKDNNARTVEIMWMWMLWFFLWQPVAVPVTAMIPLFLLPMTGVMNSNDTCKCYFNENIGLLVLSGMMILLLNNSGVDRRIALWLICSGDNCQFSGKRLVFKCSTAAFFLSMFSNKLIVASSLTQYMTPALTEMHSSFSGSKADPNYQEMSYIINSAIQTSSAIGSTAIVHSAFATLVFRGVFVECVPQGTEYEDMFNYLQYSAFVFPVALIQYIINFGYHMVLINKVVGAQMPAASMTEMRRILLKHKSTVPKRVSLHEKFTVFFMIFAIALLFCRWNAWFKYGWASSSKVEIDETTALPTIKDSTTCALIVIAMHVLPKGFGFVKYLAADKKSELPPLKPESAILWWKFVDKNLNYGYIFVMGGAIALCKAVRASALDQIVTSNIGKTLFTQYGWNTSIFLVCLCCALLANFMTGVGMVTCMMPIILHMTAAPGARAGGGLLASRRQDDAAPAPPADAGGGEASPWATKLYLGALAVGLSGSYGFVLPFLYTPAYICRHTGKTPIIKMIKYSAFSVVICLVVLWIALAYWAPVIWATEDKGFAPVAKPTPAAAEEPAPPPPAP